MSRRAFDSIKAGLQEALAIVRGEAPAAGIHWNGHHYIPAHPLDRNAQQAVEAVAPAKSKEDARLAS